MAVLHTATVPEPIILLRDIGHTQGRRPAKVMMASPKQRTHRQPRARAGKSSRLGKRQSSPGATVHDNPDIIPAWSFRDSLAIHLSRVPAEASVLTIWEAFSAYGRIVSIDLFEDSTGKRTQKGRLRFKYDFPLKMSHLVLLITLSKGHLQRHRSGIPGGTQSSWLMAARSLYRFSRRFRSAAFKFRALCSLMLLILQR